MEALKEWNKICYMQKMLQFSFNQLFQLILNWLTGQYLIFGMVLAGTGFIYACSVVKPKAIPEMWEIQQQIL